MTDAPYATIIMHLRPLFVLYGSYDKAPRATMCMIKIVKGEGVVGGEGVAVKDA